MCAFIMPATASAEQTNPASGIEANEVTNPLDDDNEYQGWIVDANNAEAARDGEKLEKLAKYMIAKQQSYQSRNYFILAIAYLRLADAYSLQRRPDEAIEAAHQAYEMIKTSEGGQSLVTARAMQRLADFLSNGGRHEEALDIARQALDLSRRVLGDEHSDTIEAMEAIGRIQNSLGHYAEALDVQRKVVTWHRKVNGVDHPDTLFAMSFLGIYLAELGLYAEGLEIQEQVVEVSRRVNGDEHPDTLFPMAALGLSLLSVGRYDEALGIQRRVLELSRKVDGEAAVSTIVAMQNLALSLFKIGRYAEALELQREVVEFNGEDSRNRPAIIGVLAIMLNVAGRAEESFELYKQALELSSRFDGPGHPTSLHLMNELAKALSKLGRSDEALELQKQTLEMCQKLLGEAHPKTLEVQESLAINLSQKGHPAQALELQKQVLELRRKVLGEEHPDTISALEGIAAILINLRRFDDALEIQQQVVAQSRKVLGEGHPTTILSINGFAALLSIYEASPQALDIQKQTLEIIRPAWGENHPNTLEAKNLLTMSLLMQPDGSPEALVYAREVYEAKIGRIAELEGLGAHGEDQARRERIKLDRSSHLFADALWVSSRGKASSGSSVEEVFQALQRGSSGTVSDAVASSAALRHAAASGVEEAARRRRDLVGQWLASEKQSLEAMGSTSQRDVARREVLGERMKEISNEIRAIDSVLEKQAPRYFSILQQAPLRILEARRLLKKGEAILLIAPTSFGTHVIVLTEKGIAWKRSELNRDHIERLVSRLRSDLDPAGTSGARGPDMSLPGAGAMPSFDRKSAHDLYAALIKPAAELLNGSSQVYIVTDGALASLPFGVLVTKEPMEGEEDADPDVLRNTAWLADAWPIVQLPSLQSLAYLRTYNRPAIGALASNGFAGFGDPLLGGKPFERGSRTDSLPAVDVNSLTGAGVTDNGALLMDPERLRRLARLPGTATELEGVRLSLKAPASSLRLAEQMTESSIRTSNLTGVGILHLATHGLTAVQSGTLAEPGLVFTPPDEATSADDGYLSSSEVIGLDLTNTDWVILSACSTAAASGKDGEAGLSGLARSFFYAGASTLLVSHWPVYDDVAARITTSTINYSATGMSRAQALQTAMQDVRLSPDPRFAHPSAWAPFSILGDGR